MHLLEWLPFHLRTAAPGMPVAHPAHRPRPPRTSPLGPGQDFARSPKAHGFVYPGYEGKESVAERIETIKNTPKPFVLMKTLGAGRIPPVDGLLFALENSKDTDIITLGLGSVEEAEESLSIVCEQVGESI